MKRNLFVAFIVLTFSACKKQDSPPAAPQVSTAQITQITATSAVGGGTIVSDGRAPVTASGICWSKTNPTPTISDDTAKTTTTTGSFTAAMANLSSGTTYYVRAYAINKAGIGYGSAVSFGALNKAPEVRGVTIDGTAKVAQPITIRYTYFDAENNPEGGTAFQWYIAVDSTGSPVTPITAATGSSYVPQASDLAKFIRVGITPKASSGTTTGVEVRSRWVGPVATADPVSVTFSYNGQTVTYGIITSPTTNRKWMDRNLGAPGAPTAYNDWANMGDLFQWGRKADGHQLINRAATTPGTTAVNGTTTTLSSSDNPGNALFILASAAPFDWRVPQNGSLWTGTGGSNNACPTGWHVPTEEEWRNENLGNLQDAYTKLRITAGGMRNFNDGSFSNTTINGLYWTSTIFNGSTLVPFSFNVTTVNTTAFSLTDKVNAVGLSVRCIKD